MPSYECRECGSEYTYPGHAAQCEENCRKYWDSFPSHKAERWTQEDD